MNEWLAREGYLRLKKAPQPLSRLRMEDIDWSGTRVWGEGGYYSRLFFNVEGREPQGVIPSGNYEKLRSEIIEKLEALGDEQGNPIGTRVHRPEDLYRTTRNVPPDLIAYFGDLDWRSVGSVGMGCLHTFENDTGPDDANHDYNGLFILTDPRISVSEQGRELEGISLYDVAPTLLDCLGLKVPADLLGKRILEKAGDETQG